MRVGQLEGFKTGLNGYILSFKKALTGSEFPEFFMGLLNSHYLQDHVE